MKSHLPIVFLLIIVSVTFVCACTNQTVVDKSKIPTADSPYSKIQVTKGGWVTLDGKTVTLDRLDHELAALAQKHGVVLYSREVPQEEPHPIFKNVLAIVAKNNLPVMLCQTSDCSDMLTFDGKLRIEK